MSQALRSLFLLLLFLLLQQQYGHAQYGNEWINHSRTYWKFNTGTDGIFRISKESLDAAGVPSTAAGTDYILYRNGKEVTLYTTTDLAFATGDYIEFYAFAADGYADKELYLDTATQADEEASLFSDTAAYFLTVDHSSSHARYTRISTAIPPVPPPAPAYNWQTLSYHGRGYYLAGKTSQKRNNFYSSQFDPAEGFIDALHNARDVVSKTIPTPNRVSTAPVNALLRLNSLAYNYYDSLHHLKVSFNGKVVADSTYGAGDIRKFYLQIPAASLTASNTLSAAHYSTAPSPDVSGWAYWSLEYPANFTATGLDYLSFKLEASASPQYLEFSGFNHGGTAPKLYDLTNNKWYSGDISVSGKTKFYVDASLTQSKMLLYAGASTRIYNLNTARQVNFIDYSNAAQQGNYIIISHRNFSGANGGKNYIGGYKNYRSSAAGGSYKVVSVDVEDLYDQFAWGISTHPSSIRHFLDYAYDKWSTRPTNVFLIGKPMLLNVYRTYLAYSGDYEYEGTVPAYGNPGSDIDFVNDRHTWKMKMAISRLSAWKGTEVADYLEKVKAYEASLAPAAFPTPATELWKKEVLHIAGGDGTTPDLQASILLPTLNQCRDIISSKPLAAHVTTVAKSTKGLPTTIEDKTVDSLISNGVSMITYYGHGSAYTLDYNMKDPSEYHSLPRIPFFSAFGCAISDIFELAKTRTASEEWIMAPNSGAIVSLAPSNLGFTSFHSLYMPSLYKILTGTYTGRTIGDIYRACNDSLAQFAPPDNSSSNLTHLECYILQGDPAVHIPQPSAKPDFYTDNKLISNIPVAVSTAMDSFKLKIVCYNLGKVNGDTLRIKIEHRNPAGASTVSGYILARNLLYSDTVDLNIPVNKTKDVGLNKYIVTLDPDNVYDETSEANNTGSLDIFIYSDNLVPVYPENYGIVYKPELTLKASTLNVFRGNGAYLFELDTTELFNSSAKMQTRLSGKGGVIGWKPALMMTDSTVYYWRCTIDTLVNGAYNWAYSSFIYLKNGTAGWNQSHYYQYLHNTLDSLDYNTDRKFSYQQSASAIRVINGVLELPAPYAFYQNSPYCKVFQDGADLQLFDCQYTGNLQIMVFDSVTGKTWENPPGGRQGALAPCAVNRNQFCFSFPLSTAASRNKAMKFLDSIPNGYYIVLKNCIYHPQWSKAYVSTWMNDTLANGSGISLYHSMRRLGFNQIDSFYREIPFAMICKKGSASYPVQQHYGTVADELQDVTFSFPVLEERGRMNSVVIGPALAWKSLKWRTSNKTDTANNADSAAVKITGIDAAAHETELYAGAARDVNIEFISATAYPKLKLQWFSQDTIYHSAPQLDYWRILYSPMPEAALDPGSWYTFTDSVNTGEQVKLDLAIATLNEVPMDSMLVRYRVIDVNGVTHNLADKKFRKLAGNDSLHAFVSFDPKSYPGNNYLFIEANPDNAQPELYHPNNLGYLPFSVKTDNYAPVIDVTFDGTHILDRDIISSKPFIKVLLRDENKYIALKDTSTMKMYLRYPSDNAGTRHSIAFDNSSCRFIPADISSGKNEAYIEFRPQFTEDGIYQLYVDGQDASGNAAGDNNDYSISFEVVNKATISNLLNYPNPFSTATAFVFTLTGWQIPSQLKIQVLTVTGKVVREITKNELGPIHIGRNITEFKWDGRDQFGQELGNGVYLYRVVTSVDGKDIEHRNSAADRFYKNGYSKMYIMR